MNKRNIAYGILFCGVTLGGCVVYMFTFEVIMAISELDGYLGWVITNVGMLFNIALIWAFTEVSKPWPGGE